MMFRKHRIRRRMLDGEFSTRVLKQHAPDPSNNQVPGTVSQMVGYYNKNGAQVALVHQYMQPDGRLGGRSRKPSPKALRVGNTLFVASAKVGRPNRRRLV
jgi:hypothetical protein